MKSQMSREQALAKWIDFKAQPTTDGDDEGVVASVEPEAYPAVMLRYEAKKAKLEARLVKLAGKEQRARTRHADRKGIRDMGAPPNESGTDDSRSRSSYHRGDSESEFAPSASGSNI